MKNLIHLTEDRHLYKAEVPYPSDNSIKCLVSNPNYSDDDQHDDSMPSHYILTPSGSLSAVSYSDNILWTMHLSKTVTANNEGEEDSSWFHLWYEENSESLVALSHSGAIVTIDPINATNDGAGELIGKFDNGISCAAWSADGEVLALVTLSFVERELLNGDNEEKEMEQVKVPTLMTMNTQFEILAEENLSPISEKAEESMIHICWNQKFDNPLLAVSSHDVEDGKRKVRLYKGESLELMSISRTEDGSGKLISNLMGSNRGELMAWAGSNTSNLLACVQRKGRKGRNIVFLEPNGLQHGGFKLDQRKDCEEIVGLNWNAESDLFAVTIFGTKQNTDGDNSTDYGKVQLYHRSNYHWYLKYEILYEDGTSISSVDFDQVKGYDLSVALCNRNDNTYNEWRHYVFIWDTSTTAPRSGMASVVDGCHLNMSMFQKAIIPPPMYSARISFDSSIVEVAHNPSSNTLIDFVVLSSDGTLDFCGASNSSIQDENKAKRRTIPTPTILSKLDLNSALSSSCWDASCLRQLLIIDVTDENNGDNIHVNLAAAVCSKASDMSSNLTENVVYFTIKLSQSESNSMTAQLLDVATIKLEGKLLRIVNWSDVPDEQKDGNKSALLELTDGSLFEISFSSSGDAEILPCKSESMFLEPCPWIAGMMSTSDNRGVVIGLSFRFRLYCGDRQLCDASSSFCLSPTTGFLSYVTLGSRSQLRFLPLDVLSNFDPFMGSDDNLEMLGDGYEPRNVERGSRLVSILPDKITALLQLPRGNLEAVYPRALVLPRIMSFIDKGEYHMALDMMRRQKVDMNLIVDMEPKRFLEGEEGVQRMVKQVKKMDHLNLFIASLSNFDFTVWKYPVPKWFRRCNTEEDVITKPDEFDFSTKVNQVCEKMRMSMIEMEGSDKSNDGLFLLPILSTFAKQEPPQLEDALSLIKENATKMPKSSNRMKSVLLSDKAQSSIQYLAFLADYKLLFDTALGMYDFDLAKAVARNSQMDPKVYLPLLKRLKNLPEFEAKYEVDLRLSRFEAALTHLHKSGMTGEYDVTINEDHFMKCMTFIETHKLHKLGLELFINHSQWHGQILISMGESLLREQKPDLALAIFLAAKPKNSDGAKRAARACGDWKTFFTCMVEDHGPSSQKVQDAAVTVADEVSSGRGGRYSSKRERNAAAARILIDYCQDIHGAIEMLISAELWFEARRLAILHDESEMEKAVVDAAVSYSQSCLSDFEDRIQKFEEASSRYGKVLCIRKQAKRDGKDAIQDDQNDETGSLFSLASNASNNSVRSNMSSSSVGSVSSISSVISAGATSTFSLLNDDANRHKSKFNKIGKKKKKKRKTRRERNGTKPGSEEELNSLIAKLKENIVDDEYFQTIIETITFLAQIEMIGFAKVLYETYETTRTKIDECQQLRIKEIEKKSDEEERAARREGFYEKIVLDCEPIVDQLQCKRLPQTIDTFFSFKIE